jgi:uncharacterized membrane protein YkvA (DUF1232 family)
MMDEFAPLSSTEGAAGLVGSLIKQARLIWRLLKDERVSEWVKLIPLVGLIYLLSPIDLIPDLMLPGLGELDDVAVILLSLKAFVNLCPPAIVSEHLEELLGRRGVVRPDDDSSSAAYIDASYRVLDQDEE